MSLPYDYYPAVLYAIERVSQGRTRTTACDDANINIALFEKYVNAHKELQDLLMEAERRGYDAIAEALLNPDAHPVYGRADPKMASVMSKNIQWFLEKRKPKEYGQKVQVEHNITADRAIIDALQAGKRRALAAPSDVIDAEFTELSDEELMAEMFS